MKGSVNYCKHPGVRGVSAVNLDSQCVRAASWAWCSTSEVSYQMDTISLDHEEDFVFHSGGTSYGTKMPASSISAISLLYAVWMWKGTSNGLIWFTGFISVNFLWFTTSEMGLHFNLLLYSSFSTKLSANFFTNSSLNNSCSCDGSLSLCFVGWM